ncbi:PIN-like domain-containing protein [Providencia alcalifaciens]|uniref:PIN-like domain-containing protein n=1 Tax=Providencia alcalifaciens TaxID=126385 RepID=UPI0032DAA7C2
MRNKFACFYDVKNDDEIKAIWEDENTLFIFDTNVLLSLYAFKSESRDDFFKVLSEIQTRIWIPFHVCLEFQLNRITVIKNRRISFSNLKKGVNNLQGILKLDEKSFTSLQTEFSLQKKYPEVHQNLTKLKDDIAVGVKELNEKLKLAVQALNQDIDKIDTEKLFVNSDDFIRKEIDQYFNNERVGDNFFKTQSELDEFNKDGEERYKNSIPPGYEDAPIKGDGEFFFDDLRYKRKFGDLIIFKQIIKYAKEKKQKNIIFISEDIKEDWRHIEEFDGKKILGARIELKREIYNEAGVENFLIFNIEDFMENTKKYLDVTIQSDTISNIKESLAKEAEIIKAERENSVRDKLEIYKAMKSKINNKIENEFSYYFSDDDLKKYKERLNQMTELQEKTVEKNDDINFPEDEINDNCLYKEIVYKIDSNAERRADSYIRKLTKYIYMDLPENINKELKRYRRVLDTFLTNYRDEKNQLNLNMLELECDRVSDYLENLKYFIK